MQHDVDIHSRPTRIVRSRRDPSDDRKTLVCAIAARGAGCRTCRNSLDEGAQFCGMCGERVRLRVPLTGAIVDELYEVGDPLAEGATATIYRARYLPSGLEVALKVLHPDLALDPIVTARFRREAKCLARLRNPHTVAAYDHGDTDDSLYIALELLHGEGLDVRLRTRGATPWREALTILRAVCSSLAEAHAHGIVHRGIEPSHVRIDSNDHVKVIDFGLAKLCHASADEDLTYAGQAVGTLQYMAPEQLAGRASDGRADLYALGVIGLELLLGRVRVPSGRPAVLPATVPTSVERMLLRCLAPDPSDRCATAVELGAELDRILAQGSTGPATREPIRRVFAHTSAFELEPPRLVIDAARVPAFVGARGSDPEIEVPSMPRRRWPMWALALIACGIGLGTAVAGCV